MVKLLRNTLFASLLCFTMNVNAQNPTTTPKQDSVIQLYGVVMSADSLRALPGATVTVVGKGRGTLTNEQGVFSIVVLKGDKIEFSYVGFKEHQEVIPTNLTDNQYSIIQLMVTDTAYLPAFIIKPRPTREQFERDFVNAQIPADEYEIARQNTEQAKLRVYMENMPADGKEAVSMAMAKQASRTYYSGQQAPIQLLNPFAWNEFIKAWKRGDFKKKK